MIKLVQHNVKAGNLVKDIWDFWAILAAFWKSKNTPKCKV